MQEKTLLAIAAFFHDIGKLGERAGIELSKENKKLEVEYCPVYEGDYSHKHVLWTIEFFDQVFKGMCPDELKSIYSLAGHHHLKDIEDKREVSIQVGDRLSSGHDRKTSEEKRDLRNQPWSKFQVTHFSQNELDVNDRFLVKPQFDDIYNSVDQLRIEFLEWRDRKDREKIYALYAPLWNEMVNGFASIWNEYKQNRYNEYLLVSLLHDLQKRILSWVPAATNEAAPGISLYEHQRLTAAIALCYYENSETFYYLHVELGGIQRFLYNVHKSKSALKLVRGRSIFVELLVDSLWLKLCEEVPGLSLLNIVMHKGSGFSLLLPDNSDVEKVKNILEEYKVQIFKDYNSTLRIDYYLKKSEYDNLQRSCYKNFEQEFYQESRKRKLTPFSELQLKELFSGTINEESGKSLCPFCKNKVIEFDEQKITQVADEVMCENCQKLVSIGQNEGKKDIRKIEREGDESLEIIKGSHLYVAWDDFRWRVNQNIRGLKILRATDDQSFTTGYRYISSKQGLFASGLRDDGSVIDLNEIATKSRYLAMVKGDVDNLGSIFQDLESIGESASLSRQLIWFFRGRVQEIIVEQFYGEIQPVYIGGDDFVFVGAFDLMLHFLKIVKDEFDLFFNEKLTFSCGYYLFGKSTPFFYVSEVAESYLSQVKQHGKDKISINGVLYNWNDFFALEECLRQFFMELPSGENRQFVRHFFDITNSAVRIKNQRDCKNWQERDLIWPSQFQYLCEKNSKYSDKEIVIDFFRQRVNPHDWYKSELGERYFQQAFEFYLMSSNQGE